MKRYRRASHSLPLLWAAFLLLVLLAALLLWQHFAADNNSEPMQPAGPGTVTDILQEPSPEGVAVTVTFIDVGEGDSILITTEKHAVLIDGGIYEAGGKVLSALRQAGVKSLDAVILTHPHYDHYGSLRRVLAQFPVGEFITAEVPEDQLPTASSYEKLLDTLGEKRIPAHFAAVGMTLDLEGATLQILGPIAGKRYDSLNNYSVVARLDCGETAFLFTGDAEEAAENDLIASGAALSADVLKAGHHGSATSSSAPFLQRVQPQWAVISVGEDNDYNLPSDAALRRLKQEGAALWRTDLQGCITAKSDGSTITFTTEE